MAHEDFVIQTFILQCVVKVFNPALSQGALIYIVSMFFPCQQNTSFHIPILRERVGVNDWFCVSILSLLNNQTIEALAVINIHRYLQY